MEITETLIHDFQTIWNKTHGSDAQLSFSKARKRLEKAAEHGCPLLPHCAECPKVRTCPILATEEQP